MRPRTASAAATAACAPRPCRAGCTEEALDLRELGKRRGANSDALQGRQGVASAAVCDRRLRRSPTSTLPGRAGPRAMVGATGIEPVTPPV